MTECAFVLHKIALLPQQASLSRQLYLRPTCYGFFRSWPTRRLSKLVVQFVHLCCWAVVLAPDARFFYLVPWSRTCGLGRGSSVGDRGVMGRVLNGYLSGGYLPV